MQALEEHEISCPYCGETISVLVDYAEAEQEYIEDCAVCCCPITLQIHIGEDQMLDVNAKRDCD